MRERPYTQTIFLAAAARAVWVCHFAAFGVFLVLVASWAVVDTRSVRRLALLVLPACWPLLLTIVWQIGAPHHAASFDWAIKPHWLADFLRSQWKWFDRLSAAFVLLSCAVLAALWWRGRDRRGLALIVAGLSLLGCFVVVPDQVIGSSIADARLIPPALMLLLIGFSVPPRSDRAVLVVCAAFALSRLAYTTAIWTERSSEIAAELGPIEQVPAGARIATLSYATGCDSWPLFGFDHVSALAIARKHAFVNSEWDIGDTQLMRPIYNDGRDFNEVQSSYVAKPGTACSGEPLQTRLATLPRDRFDFVWSFVGPLGASGLVPVARGRLGILYRVGAGEPHP